MLNFPIGYLVRHVKKDEERYYEELVEYSKTHLMLYPYHLSDVMVRGLRITPFQYYVTMVESIMIQERSYDALPNFTAADCKYNLLTLNQFFFSWWSFSELYYVRLKTSWNRKEPVYRFDESEQVRQKAVQKAKCPWATSNKTNPQIINRSLVDSSYWFYHGRWYESSF